MRSTTLKPLGLVTQPGKHGLPPGALSRALNVCMRDPNVISSLPDTRSYRDNIASNGYSIVRLLPCDSSVLAIVYNGGTSGAYWVASGSSSAITFPGTVGFANGRTTAVKTRNRFIVVNDADRSYVLDSEGDTTARFVGLIEPQNVQPVSATTTNAQAMADGKVARWRAVFRRDYASTGYTIVSPVSNAHELTNGSGSTVDPSFAIEWDTGYGILAGDFIELYRTDFQTTGSDAGDTYRLAVTHVITSGEASAGLATVRDTCVESALGSELYTNPGQGGLVSTNMRPPRAHDVATFKGFTFYMSFSLPSRIITRIPAKVGVLSSDAERTYGIGTRAITGDTTNASATVTNVSNMAGIAVGQIVAATGFTGAARVATVGATSFTVNQTASATNVGVSIVLTDVLDISGTVHAFATLGGLFDAVNWATLGSQVSVNVAVPHALTAGPALAYSTQSDGPQFVFETGDTLVDLRGSNGANYSPAIATMSETATASASDTRTNRYHWSKLDQPEAVRPLDYGLVGNGTLLRMIATQDVLYMFCTDGLYKLTGDAGEWRVDPVDPTLVLVARMAVDQMQGVVYAYTNRGLVAIAGDSVVELSTGMIGDLVPGADFSTSSDTFLACDELHREVWLGIRGSGSSTQYVFNTLTKAFTTVVDDEWSALAYSRPLRSLVAGVVSTNPDVAYFEVDTSATRMPGADIRFQPMTGDGDPFTLKEFVEVDYLFEGIGSAGTLVPSFDGTNYTARTLAASTIESPCRIDVPRNAPGVARRLAPGFTLSSGGTAQRWSFRGVSVKWWPAAEEAGR